MDGAMLYRVLLLIAAVQGLILGLVLFFGSSPRRSANRYLATLLFFLSYRLVAELLHSIGYIHPDTVWYHVVLEYNWVFGGLLYLYVRSYLDEAFTLTARHWVHAVPVAIEFLVSNYVKSQNFFWDGTPESLSAIGYWGYVVWMHTPLQVIVFCGLIGGYAVAGRRAIAAFSGSVPARAHLAEWLDRLLKVYVGYAIVATLVALCDYALFDYAFRPFYIYPTYGGLAVFTYWLALQGFAHRSDPALNRRRPASSATAEGNIALQQALEEAMEEGLYRDPTLNLARLATAIGAKPHQVTRVLNADLNTSFSDYVNGYRVREVKRLAADPDNEVFTLLALAFEAGFNSKASFNRVVKKMTGKPPSALRDEAP